MQEIILSTAAASQSLVLSELEKIDPQAALLAWLEAGVGQVRLQTISFSEVAPQVLAQRAVFIRHVFPVWATIDLHRTENDISSIQQALTLYLADLDQQQLTSVQLRFAAGAELPYTKADLSHVLSQTLEQAGFPLQVRHPQQIISLFCTTHQAYLGISSARENLSDWAGGMQRFAQEPEQISRSEFKLLEAIAVFNLSLPPSGIALDLGASPGGWTRILRQRGLAVVTVDPGDLHPSLQDDRQVTHHRQSVQRFLPTCRQSFDVMVNDMRMDALESVEVMLTASRLLQPKGLAVMTLKLPNQGVEAVIRRAIDRLGTKYEILGARQLFHNRQEVTLAMRRI